MIDGRAAGDRKQPGREGPPPAVAVQILIDAEKCLLRQVFGVGSQNPDAAGIAAPGFGIAAAVARNWPRIPPALGRRVRRRSSALKQGGATCRNYLFSDGWCSCQAFSRCSRIFWHISSPCFSRCFCTWAQTASAGTHHSTATVLSVAVTFSALMIFSASGSSPCFSAAAAQGLRRWSSTAGQRRLA